MDPVTFGGRYQAEHFIGVPGRLDAYSGVDTTSQTRVAIVTASVGTDAQASEWTMRAQSAASFEHADVAKLLDWGRDGDRFFTVQDWVAGNDIGTVVSRQGPVASEKVAAYGAQVAAALSAAHAHGVVHGDIRPEDVVLRTDDDAVLAGLGGPGLADAWSVAPDATPAAVWFMSPEQCSGQKPSAQSDVYSLGAVLYYAATGRVPFDGPDAATVCASQKGASVPSPRSINPYVPAALEAVILRALAKSPESRYGSAEEMRQALEAVAGGGATPTQVMPVVAEEPKKRKVWPWIVGLLIALALVGAGLAVAWWLGYIGGVQVPDVSGQTPTEAAKTLDNAQLKIGNISASDNYPQGAKLGTVFEQSPASGGQARKGATVNVTIAGGETIKVPNVVGASESEALITLTNAGFQPAPVQRKFDKKVDAGTVISQTPPADAEELKGSAVTITVSKGPETGTVPNVLGKSEADATNAIQDAGFKVQVEQTQADNVPKGQVAQQSPGGGVKADIDSTVTIYVSTGAPVPQQVTIPNVVGQTENDALNTLQNLGLKTQIQRVADPANVGKVVATDPGVGSTVDVGSTVTMQVGQ